PRLHPMRPRGIPGNRTHVVLHRPVRWRGECTSEDPDPALSRRAAHTPGAHVGETTHASARGREGQRRSRDRSVCCPAMLSAPRAWYRGADRARMMTGRCLDSLGRRRAGATVMDSWQRGCVLVVLRPYVLEVSGLQPCQWLLAHSRILAGSCKHDVRRSADTGTGFAESSYVSPLIRR